MNPKFSFIIPLYNEEDIIETLINRMNQLIERIESPCEVVLIDDGSCDATTRLIEELAINDSKYLCIFFSRNFGQQKAFSAGLDYSRGDYIMFLDADLQDPPELFFKFYDKILEGYDIVYGIRENRKENIFKKTAYKTFYQLLNRIADYPIPLDTGDFSLINRKIANQMIKMREESRFLRGMRSWIGFKQIGLKYNRSTRAIGEPKYTFRKLLNLALDGIFNYSIFPIKFLSYCGLSCVGISFIYFLITLIRKFVYKDVPLGFTALLFVIILFGGIQLLSIGIIGEYMQRVFFQVKNRPLYIIDKTIIDGERHDQ